MLFASDRGQLTLAAYAQNLDELIARCQVDRVIPLLVEYSGER